MKHKTKKQNVLLTGYKFRSYFKTETQFRLPEEVFTEARREQDLWNKLVAERQRRSDAWKTAHPEYLAMLKALEAASSDEERKAVPRVKFGDEQFFKAWRDWSHEQCAAHGMTTERNQDVLNRFDSVMRRLKTGGGLPREQRRLDSFSILLIRYTGGGAQLKALCGASRRFRMEFPSPDAYRRNDHESRRERLTGAWFSLGEETIGLNVILHRQIPYDAIIKRVYLSGFRNCGKWELYLSVVASIAAPEVSTSPRRVGIAVGWRKLEKEDGIRVATCYDGKSKLTCWLPLRFYRKGLGIISPETINAVKWTRSMFITGATRKLEDAVPPELLSAESADILESAKRRGIKIRLKEFLNSRGIHGQAFDRLGAGGLHRIERELRERAVTETLDLPSQEALQQLSSWKIGYAQLLRKESMMRSAWNARRKAIYEEFAAQLAKSYGSIGIQQLKLAKLYERAANEEEKLHDNYALWNSRERRGYVAIGSLVTAIKNRARRDGIAVTEVSGCSAQCSKCGSDFFVDVDVIGRCRNGHAIDTDENVARNIFAQIGSGHFAEEAA